jgi:hypothetical protein
MQPTQDSNNEKGENRKKCPKHMPQIPPETRGDTSERNRGTECDERMAFSVKLLHPETSRHILDPPLILVTSLCLSFLRGEMVTGNSTLWNYSMQHEITQGMQCVWGSIAQC